VSNQEKRKMHGPQNPNCDLIHKEKYRGANEDFRECINRISGALTDSQEHFQRFRDICLHQRFLPPGRVQRGAGSLHNITLFNCFVMGTLHDSFTDGPTDEELSTIWANTHAPMSIMDTAKAAAKTMRFGGGVGYDISPLRPSGDMIYGVGAITDGPLAFAPIYDAVCRATSSAGNRRGAQMLTMRIDHPDIEAFIRAKQVHDDSIPWAMRPLRGFNMSVSVTDEFMECLESGTMFKLRFGGKVYREVDPTALWNMIMRGAYDFAEPGIIFIDRINAMNNLYYCEEIASTNPCGEQPLPPFGACLLGSINLVKYLIKDDKENYQFNYGLLAADMEDIVRAMDNVIDRSRFPLEQQKEEAQAKRRMGLGVTGLANTIEAMGHEYGTPAFLKVQNKIQHLMTRHCYLASVELAKEKGSFPLFNREKYCAGEFIKTLDVDVQEAIWEHGIRNSHLTSIAPTGTISLTADNISSSIEPVFSLSQRRSVIMSDGKRDVIIPDYGYEYLGVFGKTVDSGRITAKEHADVLCTAQKYIDSACSKTVNVPHEFAFDDYKDLFLYVYKNGGKGCTVYRPNNKYDEPLKSAEAEAPSAEADSCGYDPVTGQRTGPCSE
jgi:ribonucleoside-diphosphate reductase alpha chain